MRASSLAPTSLCRSAVVVFRTILIMRVTAGHAVIQGGRVDDLAYLAKHKIDRNLVSREIAEITARMIHITGASRHPAEIGLRRSPASDPG